MWGRRWLVVELGLFWKFMFLLLGHIASSYNVSTIWSMIYARPRVLLCAVLSTVSESHLSKGHIMYGMVGGDLNPRPCYHRAWAIIFLDVTQVALGTDLMGYQVSEKQGAGHLK